MIYIVTVNYNDDINLLRTIESVKIHKKSYHRFVIIDGGSTDDSLLHIHNNKEIIDSYISEKDNGIYDAMNKVIRFQLCESDFIIWINAGDELIDWEGKISIENLQNYDAAFFSVIAKLYPNQVGAIKKPTIYLPYNEKNFYPKSIFYHQGFMIKFEIFKKYLYNLNIGLQAENLLMSNVISNDHFYVSNEPLSIYYLGGISNQKYLIVLKSYIKVGAALKFDYRKFFFCKILFLLKLSLLSLTPKTIIETIKKKIYAK